MSSPSTRDFRRLLSHMTTRWLEASFTDWRANGVASIQGMTLKARCMAMLRAELRARKNDAPKFTDISHITEYGITSRLQSAIRVF